MTPYILNYSNEVATFPAYEIIPGQIQMQSGTKRLRVQGQQRDLKAIQPGGFIVCDTGNQQAEVRKVTGVDRRARIIVIDEPFTVSSASTTIKYAEGQQDGIMCLYNNGNSVVYLGGQALAAGQKIIASVKQSGYPSVLYATGSYQVSNAIITDASGGDGGDSNNYFPSL